MNARSDAEYMATALSLAARGRGFTSPNPVVGAVVVDKEGAIVGSGYHRRYGGPHAEVHALAEAGARARGATMYVTLEPCCVWGKTPPCTEAIVRAGVGAVVVPIEDPNPDVSGRGLARLRARGVEVRTGVLREEAVLQNAGYLKLRASGLPFVLLKLAMSLDGRVAPPAGGPRWISSAASRDRVHEMRAEADCVMVGVGTVLADDPLLTDRRGEAALRQPSRLVLDSRLRIPTGCSLVRGAGQIPTIVVCTEEADARAEDRLIGLGVPVWRCASTPAGVDLEDALRRAAGHGFVNVLSEGGPRLAASLLDTGLVDRVTFFVSPVLFGSEGTAGFAKLGPRWWERDAFEGARWADSGGDLLFEASVASDRAPATAR